MLSRAYSEKTYTLDEFIKFIKSEKDKSGNENNQYELIDGYIYLMGSPTVTHQRIAGFIYNAISSYLKGKQCEAFIAPLDVLLFDLNKIRLFNQCSNVFQPDIFVVCDKNKITENRIEGAPDFVVEIVSKSTSANDYIYKLNNYMTFGVKEYWIVNPQTRQITVYINDDSDIIVYNYTFNDIIKSRLFETLYIDFKEIEIN